MAQSISLWSRLQALPPAPISWAQGTQRPVTQWKTDALSRWTHKGQQSHLSFTEEFGDPLKGSSISMENWPLQSYKDGEGPRRQDVWGVQKPLGLLRPEQRSWGEASWWLQLLTGNRGAALSSALRWQWQDLLELSQGGLGWVLGKRSAPEGGQALEQAPHGSRHSPELPELRKSLDNGVGHRVWILGGSVWCQGLDLMVPSNSGCSMFLIPAEEFLPAVVISKLE